ncbi:MAG: pyridoxal phosphate-dependent aminotransferase, partial [Nanoarchaeota archaeon]
QRDEALESKINVVVGTAGGRSIITSTFKALVKQGDVVLVPDPAWSGYEALARDARVHLVDISTNSENNFVPNKKSIEAAIEKAASLYPGSEVKLMIMNTPHNPTGTVYNESDIAEILATLKEKKIKGLVDYTYRSIRAEGIGVPSAHKIAEKLAAKAGVPLKEYTDDLIAMQTLGKVTLTPGFRVGYVMSTDPDFIGKFSVEKQANDLSGHIFLETAFAEYLGTQGQKDDFAKTVEQFEERRAYLLKQLKEFNYSPEQGNVVANPVGFYLTFEVPKRFKEEEMPLSNISEIFDRYPFIRQTVSEEEYKKLFESRGYVPASELFALELVDKSAVAVCPGHLFTKESNPENGYENWCRVALIQPVSKLEDMFHRLKDHKSILQY